MFGLGMRRILCRLGDACCTLGSVRGLPAHCSHSILVKHALQSDLITQNGARTHAAGPFSLVRSLGSECPTARPSPSGSDCVGAQSKQAALSLGAAGGVKRHFQLEVSQTFRSSKQTLSRPVAAAAEQGVLMRINSLSHKRATVLPPNQWMYVEQNKLRAEHILFPLTYLRTWSSAQM